MAERNLQSNQSPDNSDYSQDPIPLVPFGRLLNTRLEAKRIAGLWSADKLTVFTGLDVNRQKFMMSNSEQPRFLHIAAHGLFSDSHPENSGLLLSQFDENGVRTGGLLSVKDIFQMHLKSDLVVLSSCQSGLGEEFPGEGLTGLKHALFYAGAKSAIVSLWQVNDESTADLMHEFYRSLLEDQLSTPAALRQAKLKIYYENGWEHPFYWGAFTLHGDYLITNPAKSRFPSSAHIFFLITLFILIVISFSLFHIKKGR